MIADRRGAARILYCPCHNPGSGLTDIQLNELEAHLLSNIEALSAQAHRIRELRRRLCPPTNDRDAVRAMLDERLAGTRAEFSATARVLLACRRPMKCQVSS